MSKQLGGYEDEGTNALAMAELKRIADNKAEAARLGVDLADLHRRFMAMDNDDAMARNNVQQQVIVDRIDALLGSDAWNISTTTGAIFFDGAVLSS